MRECRVIEGCVNILHTPFAKGIFDFEQITQDMAITGICKLVYELLTKIINGYALNELYASQWIKLFMKHVSMTQSNNQIGADNFCTVLCDQNK